VLVKEGVRSSGVAGVQQFGSLNLGPENRGLLLVLVVLVLESARQIPVQDRVVETYLQRY
jgi:hypothetical protein